MKTIYDSVYSNDNDVHVIYNTPFAWPNHIRVFINLIAQEWLWDNRCVPHGQVPLLEYLLPPAGATLRSMPHVALIVTHKCVRTRATDCHRRVSFCARRDR